MQTLLKKCIAEFLGTFVIVLAGCGAIATNHLTNGAVSHLGIATAFGLSVLIMIYTLGHISGAHFNPAVTIAFAIQSRFPKKQVVPYILAQCVGAITASLIHATTIKLPDNAVLSIGTTLPYDNLFGTAFLWEFILTALLMLVIMSVATDYRVVGTLSGGVIGGTVWLEALFAGPICNASMNPARSLGPALVSGNFEHLGAYFLGPILGAIAGAYLYDFIRCDPTNKEDIKGCC